MNMCIITIEIQQTIFVGVYDHKRFYSCKQNNNYSLAYMNNRIAINMIQSYSCSTQTLNNTYLVSTLISKSRNTAHGAPTPPPAISTPLGDLHLQPLIPSSPPVYLFGA